MSGLLRAKLLNIRIGVYQFTPGIFTTLVTGFLLYVMVSMGMWQYNKAAFKEDLQTKIENRKDLPPTELHLLPESSSERKYLPVTLTGRFDDEHHFLYDNRIVNGVAGYHVYTPFITGSGTELLVNRGWVPQQRTRDSLPDVSVTQKLLSITGLIDDLPSRGVLLSEGLHDEVSWPMVLQYVDDAEASTMTGRQIADMILWLGPGTEHGFHHEYPSLNLDAAKNSGYAFQWFAMTLALSIIWLVTNTHKTVENEDEEQQSA